MHWFIELFIAFARILPRLLERVDSEYSKNFYVSFVECKWSNNINNNGNDDGDDWNNRPEDSVSKEIRRRLVAKQQQRDQGYINDDEQFDRLPPWTMPMLPIVFLLLTGASWYKKRLELQRSGRHKKIDS